jgi:hypothetical protein
MVQSEERGRDGRQDAAALHYCCAIAFEVSEFQQLLHGRLRHNILLILRKIINNVIYDQRSTNALIWLSMSSHKSRLKIITLSLFLFLHQTVNMSNKCFITVLYNARGNILSCMLCDAKQVSTASLVQKISCENNFYLTSELSQHLWIPIRLF